MLFKSAKICNNSAKNYDYSVEISNHQGPIKFEIVKRKCTGASEIGEQLRSNLTCFFFVIDELKSSAYFTHRVFLSRTFPCILTSIVCRAIWNYHAIVNFLMASNRTRVILPSLKNSFVHVISELESISRTHTRAYNLTLLGNFHEKNRMVVGMICFFVRNIFDCFQPLGII